MSLLKPQIHCSHESQLVVPGHVLLSVLYVLAAEDRHFSKMMMIVRDKLVGFDGLGCGDRRLCKSGSEDRGIAAV